MPRIGRLDVIATSRTPGRASNSRWNRSVTTCWLVESGYVSSGSPSRAVMMFSLSSP